MKLTFIYAPTTDLSAELTFYRDELGWDEAWREGADTVAFQVPRSEVQVMVTAAAAHERPGAVYLVDDVAAFLAGTPSLKVTIPARPIPDGGVVAGVQDPTGTAFYVFDQPALVVRPDRRAGCPGAGRTSTMQAGRRHRPSPTGRGRGFCVAR